MVGETRSETLAQTAINTSRDALALATAVNAALESHERYCGERHRDRKVWEERSTTAREAMRAELSEKMDDMLATVMTKLESVRTESSGGRRAIYGRIWAATTALVVVLLGVIAHLYQHQAPIIQ